MGFDVALVDGGGAEVALEDHVGRGKAGLYVALFKNYVLGDVAGGLGEFAGGFHAQIGMQDRGAGGDGGLGVEDGVEDVVFDVDQAKGLRRDMETLA